MGILGEYVGAIYTQVQRRPLVTEVERVNFEFGPGEPLRETADSRVLKDTEGY